MRHARRVATALAFVAVGVSAGACATPPDREIALAEAAITAARDAHVDVIAPAEFAAAAAYLDQSRDAVRVGDYRLALSRALDAREQANIAIRLAEDRRVVIIQDVETALATIQAVRDRMAAGLTRARASTPPRPGLAGIEATIANVDRAVQEARSALANGDPVSARDHLDGVLEQLREVVDALESGTHVSS